MRIVSWNVNGIRAVLKKGFCFSVENMNPDILCLQEIKADKSVIPSVTLEGYDVVYNHAVRKGYSGTAVFFRKQPLTIDCNTYMDSLTSVSEGRVILLEYESFFLINAYTPNSGSELARLQFRHHVWDVEMLNFITKLKERKPVILCGDMNVAHKEIDLSNPNSNHFSAGFTDEERFGISRCFETFGIDSFRKFYPDKPNCYSWWSYRAKSRERNIGWRIDYVIVDKILEHLLSNAFIFSDIHGSDHAPAGADIDL